MMPGFSNKKVVFFFGTGRVNSDSTSFMMLAKADAVIICLGTNEVRVAKRDDASGTPDMELPRPEGVARVR